MKLKEHWNLLNWKGDDHTNGVYFDAEYGYVLERNYAVRLKHCESSPSVFYIPDFSLEEEDKVITEYPYKNMTKRPNKYRPLFTGNQVDQGELILLFQENGIEWTELPVAPILDALSSITKKRERDRSWLVVERNDEKTFLRVVGKDKSVNDVRLKGNCEGGGEAFLTAVNANEMYHALNLFYSSKSILFSKSHDKIKLTSERKSSNVEVILSLPKDSIQTEISERILR